MSCTKCNSSLVTLNTSTSVHTCNACGTAWSIIHSLQCNGCNGVVNMNRKLRLIKDGKTGWHQCDNCGMYANIDDKRDVIKEETKN